MRILSYEISVTKAMVFGENVDNSFSGSSFKGINMAYWNDIIDRISKDTHRIINAKNSELLKTINFRFGLGIQELGDIDTIV